MQPQIFATQTSTIERGDKQYLCQDFAFPEGFDFETLGKELYNVLGEESFISSREVNTVGPFTLIGEEPGYEEARKFLPFEFFPYLARAMIDINTLRHQDEPHIDIEVAQKRFLENVAIALERMHRENREGKPSLWLFEFGKGPTFEIKAPTRAAEILSEGKITRE